MGLWEALSVASIRHGAMPDCRTRAARPTTDRRCRADMPEFFEPFWRLFAWFCGPHFLFTHEMMRPCMERQSYIECWLLHHNNRQNTLDGLLPCVMWFSPFVPLYTPCEHGPSTILRLSPTSGPPSRLTQAIGSQRGRAGRLQRDDGVPVPDPKSHVIPCGVGTAAGAGNTLPQGAALSSVHQRNAVIGMAPQHNYR